MLWVALAGPAANLFMAILWGISLRLLFESGDRGSFWFQMAQVGIQINLTLMALNLLPILPLDGGRVLFSLLPNQLAWQFGRIEPFGLWIVIALLATGTLGTLIAPMMSLGEWVVRLVL
jgi:Zn-dependent protease